MRTLLCLLVLTLATGGQSQTPQAAVNLTSSGQHFDGRWWLATDPEERSGFMNGVSDCLTWTAHKKGFEATPEQLADKITSFYKMHPQSASLGVLDAWQEVWRKMVKHSFQGKASDERGGETWINPHWYLNGDWWSQIDQPKQMGFIEGYLWCMRTQVPSPTETYSETASSCHRKVDDYVKANPKKGKEAVATTLRRYCDKKTFVSPK